MGEIIYREESYAIIGACMHVHSQLGAGFLEAVYHEALEREFSLRKIPFQTKAPLRIHYGDLALSKKYIADFVCYERIVIEIKSTSFLHPNFLNQTLNYLKATNFKLGLLVNFGEPRLNYKRILN